MPENPDVYRLYAEAGDAESIPEVSKARRWLAYAAALAGAFTWASVLVPAAEDRGEVQRDAAQ